jgi:hypothetical protein
VLDGKLEGDWLGVSDGEPEGDTLGVPVG